MKSPYSAPSIALVAALLWPAPALAQELIRPPEAAKDDRSNFVNYDIEAVLDNEKPIKFDPEPEDGPEGESFTPYTRWGGRVRTPRREAAREGESANLNASGQRGASLDRGTYPPIIV